MTKFVIKTGYAMFRTLSKRILVVKKQKKFRTLLHVRKFENDDYRERYNIRFLLQLLN